MTRKRTRKARYKADEWQNQFAPNPVWKSHKGRPFIVTALKNDEHTGLWQARTLASQELICAEQFELPLDNDHVVQALALHIKNLVDMTCDALEDKIAKDKVGNT